MLPLPQGSRVPLSSTRSRRLKNLLRFSFFIFLGGGIISCGNRTVEKEVASAYDRLVAAVQAENKEAVFTIVPHLKEDPSGKAFQGLQALVLSAKKYTVHRIDARTAEVILDSTPKKSIPFQRDASGSWVVPEKIVRTQFIDFLPAR